MPFVCEYFGFLEHFKHLVMDLSRENHIKVLILFVTIAIGAFRLSAIASANLPFTAKTKGVKGRFSICNTRSP